MEISSTPWCDIHNSECRLFDTDSDQWVCRTCLAEGLGYSNPVSSNGGGSNSRQTLITAAKQFTQPPLETRPHPQRQEEIPSHGSSRLFKETMVAMPVAQYFEQAIPSHSPAPSKNREDVQNDTHDASTIDGSRFFSTRPLHSESRLQALQTSRERRNFFGRHQFLPPAQPTSTAQPIPLLQPKHTAQPFRPVEPLDMVRLSLSAMATPQAKPTPQKPHSNTDAGSRQTIFNKETLQKSEGLTASATFANASQIVRTPGRSAGSNSAALGPLGPQSISRPTYAIVADIPRAEDFPELNNGIKGAKLDLGSLPSGVWKPVTSRAEQKKLAKSLQGKAGDGSVFVMGGVRWDETGPSNRYAVAVIRHKIFPGTKCTIENCGGEHPTELHFYMWEFWLKIVTPRDKFEILGPCQMCIDEKKPENKITHVKRDHQQSQWYDSPENFDILQFPHLEYLWQYLKPYPDKNSAVRPYPITFYVRAIKHIPNVPDFDDSEGYLCSGLWNQKSRTPLQEQANAQLTREKNWDARLLLPHGAESQPKQEAWLKFKGRGTGRLGEKKESRNQSSGRSANSAASAGWDGTQPKQGLPPPHWNSENTQFPADKFIMEISSIMRVEDKDFINYLRNKYFAAGQQMQDTQDADTIASLNKQMKAYCVDARGLLEVYIPHWVPMSENYTFKIAQPLQAEIDMYYDMWKRTESNRAQKLEAKSAQTNVDTDEDFWAGDRYYSIQWDNEFVPADRPIFDKPVDWNSTIDVDGQKIPVAPSDPRDHLRMDVYPREVRHFTAHLDFFATHMRTYADKETKLDFLVWLKQQHDFFNQTLFPNLPPSKTLDRLTYHQSDLRAHFSNLYSTLGHALDTRPRIEEVNGSYFDSVKNDVENAFYNYGVEVGVTIGKIRADHDIEEVFKPKRLQMNESVWRGLLGAHLPAAMAPRTCLPRLVWPKPFMNYVRASQRARDIADQPCP